MGRQAFGMTKKKAGDFKKSGKVKQTKPKAKAAGAMHNVPAHKRMFE